MIDSLVSGRLIKIPELKVGQSGKHYCQILLSVQTGESEATIVSGICFESIAERVSKLQKGDSLAVIGSLKLTSWTDRKTDEEKHGLSITVNNSLSVYDIQKRRKPKPDAGNSPSVNNPQPFDDSLDF